MAKVYKTSRGRTLDMEKLILKNETVIAAGNQLVNARGDQIDHMGNIIETRNQSMKKHYRPNKPSDTPVFDNAIQADSYAKDNSKEVQDEIARLKEELRIAQVGKETSQFKPKEETVEENTEPTVIEPSTSDAAPLRGGLASAIQKDLDYKAKMEPKRRI